MGQRVAMVGAGMTKFVRRAQETGKELSFEATKMALDYCDLSLDQVDCVVHGTAPDSFDGVHMKGEYLADGSGAWRKPYTRCYVGGGTGVFTPIHGWYHVASGLFDICLVVCEEKMSSCQPHPQGAFLTIFDQFTERPLGPNLLWIFALEMNAYMNRYGLSKRDIATVSVKNKRNAADHPAALLGNPDITVDDVLNSEVLARPAQRLDAILRVGYLSSADVGNLARLNVNFLALAAGKMTQDLITAARERGQSVYAWTVNDREMMLDMIELGTDSLITDNPALANDVIAQVMDLLPVERLLLRFRHFWDLFDERITAPVDPEE